MNQLVEIETAGAEAALAALQPALDVESMVSGFQAIFREIARQSEVFQQIAKAAAEALKPAAMAAAALEQMAKSWISQGSENRLCLELQDGARLVALRREDFQRLARARLVAIRRAWRARVHRISHVIFVIVLPNGPNAISSRIFTTGQAIPIQ